MAHKRSRRDFEADLQAQQSPYAFFGTPLPPLDPDVRDDGSYVPIWKQEVTDERGRKRLHGAFTGGFSAGYFNTVGSKEGWTPSTFQSSRTNRAKDASTLQRAEDFMDEEDLADAAEAQQVQTQGAFAGLGDESDAKPRGVLMDLFRPQEDTAGVTLLRKMGWRDGQGIGPRIKRKAQLADTNNDQGDRDAESRLFAPEDSPLIALRRKDDSMGLGYGSEAKLLRPASRSKVSEDEDDNDDVTGSSSTTKATQGRKPQRRTGIGIGVLNEDSDEGDPYEMGPRISYNKTVGGAKKSKKATKIKEQATSANPMLKSKPVFTSKKINALASSLRRCRDGKLPLDGFVLTEPLDPKASHVEAEKYAPPEMPLDWKSSKVQLGEEKQRQAYQSTTEAAKVSTLNIHARAGLLGEQRLPGKSIFDFISPAARERLASASGRKDLPAGLGEKLPLDSRRAEEEEESLTPSIERSVALAALGRGVGGWMPYAEDEVKRDRYKAFLEFNGGLRTQPLDRPSKTSKDAWLKELAEFAHAAEVFKPMTGAMASRFTSATTLPGAAEPKAEVGDTSMQSKPESEICEDPAEAAAKAGMFGPMTRSVAQFFPPRLLCKRFGVKLPPHVEAAGLEAQQGDNMHKESNRSPGPPQNAVPTGEESGSSLLAPLAVPQRPEQNDTKSIDASTNEALEGKRAAEAVFQSIFGDDDDSE